MASNRTSPIWTYFTVKNENDQKAQCTLCKTEIVRGKTVKQYGTKSMLNHVRNKHPDEFREVEKEQKRKADESLKSPHPAKKPKMEPPKMSEFLDRTRSFSSDHPRAKQIDDGIGVMIAVDEQPFYVVEKQGFRWLVEILEPRYTLRSRKYYADTVIPLLHKRLEKCVADEILLAEDISFTTDEWTDEFTTTSYLTVTARWLDQQFKLHSAVLALVHLTEAKTGHYLSREFLGVLRKWSIPVEKVHIVMRDNGPNIAKAMRDAKVRSMGCLAHTMQLAINDSLFKQISVSDVLKLGRSIVGHFKHSSTAKERLTGFQQTLQVPSHCLIQDVQTRWNSSYLMLERLIEQKQALSLYSTQHGLEIFSTAQWTVAENVITVLKFFETETRRLSFTEACASDIIPTTTILFHALENLRPPRLGAMKKALIDSMKNRFKVYQESEDLLLATILDARYKNKFFSDSSTQEKAEKVLKDRVSQVDGGQGDTEDSPADSDSENAESSDDPCPWQSFRRSQALVESKYTHINY